MGYDLRNRQGDYFRANTSGWDHLTEAALAFDWKPAGTLPPEFDEGGGALLVTTHSIRDGTAITPAMTISA
jgi:hypothetical protein